MLCSNQEMIRSVLPFLADEPPVLCDWLPWNHTAGGNHNFGLVLYNGGTLYIDEGRPMPARFEATVRNLREIAATAHFTVPRTYEMLLPLPARRRGAARAVLRQAEAVLLRRGRTDASACSTSCRRLAVETCGEELLWVTGLGATETAPFALCTGARGRLGRLRRLPGSRAWS